VLSLGKWLLAKIVLWWERYKGPGKIISAPEPVKHQTTVRAISMDGFELTIYVNKTVFSQNYDRWFVTTKSKAIYDVYAVASNDAPQVLRDITLMYQRSFPTMLPDYIPEEVQRDYVLMAYLDAITDLYKRKTGIAA